MFEANRQNRPSFEELYAEFHHPVFCFAYHLTRNRGEAEDLFQDAWLRIVKHLPEEVKMVGTIRTHDQAIRKRVHALMRQVIKGVCLSNGTNFELNLHSGAPVTYNEPRLTQWSVGVIKGLIGEEKVFEAPPSMGSEDFSIYSQEIPAFFYFLGVSNDQPEYQFPVHNPYFCADEGSIPLGVESMVNLVIEFLASKEKYSLEK